MKNNELSVLNICQVALVGDLPIIKENIKEFNKYYSNVNFFLICPSKELNIFSKLKSNKIFIINEDSIISYKKFYKISKSKLRKSNYDKIIQKRLKWYYQQVLKISFIVNFFFNLIYICDKCIFFNINKICYQTQLINRSYGSGEC